MNLAAVALLVLVFGLVVFDWATLRGKNRRALLLEMTAFVAGAFFIAFPERATTLAHMVGIGRGVAHSFDPVARKHRRIFLRTGFGCRDHYPFRLSERRERSAARAGHIYY